MSSVSVCQVARSWVDMGSFHTGLVVRFMNVTVSGYTLILVVLVRMLASGTQDHGFDPGRSCQIFQTKKSTVRLPLEGK
jgi:hypothetical protein